MADEWRKASLNQPGRIITLYERRIRTAHAERGQVETVENFDANNFAQDIRTGRIQERVDREAGAACDAIAARVRTHFAACTVPG